jgi:protein TonB
MAKININSDQWCDMVFEDRNTSFGAYVLRTESSKRHLRALIIASILFVFAITAPILIKEVMKSVKKTDTTVRTLDYLDQVKKQAKEETPKEEMPKEEQQQLIRSTIAFPPPVISEKAPDTIITQESLTKRTEAISTVTVVGNTNTGAVPVTNNIAPTTEAKPEENKIYDVVQVQPNFPGGMNALYEYLSKHINYPPSAREAGVEGKVIVGFVVGKDGRIADVQVLRSLDPACDEEAVKLVKSMPAWTPGKQGDKMVRVRMTLPIVFKLDN